MLFATTSTLDRAHVKRDMRGMIRSALCCVLIASLSTTMASASSSEKYIPTDRWALDDSEAVCVITRHFLLQDKALTLSVVPVPLSDILYLSIDSSLHNNAPAKGFVNVMIESSDKKLRLSYQKTPSKSAKVSKLFISMKRMELSLLAKAGSLSFDVDGSQPISLVPSGMSAALQASTSCEARLLADVGFTPNPKDAFATVSAVPVATTGDDWVQTSDYPEGLAPGRAVIGWIVGTDGRVHNCRGLTFGADPRLAESACAGLTKRGKFSPARDENGIAVPSFVTKPMAVR